MIYASVVGEISGYDAMISAENGERRRMGSDRIEARKSVEAGFCRS